MKQHLKYIFANMPACLSGQPYLQTGRDEKGTYTDNSNDNISQINNNAKNNFQSNHKTIFQSAGIRLTDSVALVYSFFLFSLFFFAPFHSQGQPSYVWAKGIGGITGDIDYGIAVDVSGNVYITGIFQSIVDFDPGSGTANLTSAGNNDIFFAKYDSSGNYLWANRIGGTGTDYGYGIAVDGLGNVYITGYFYGTADFDPGAGTANLTSAGGTADIFFAKYDGSGNYLWANRIGGTSTDYGENISVDGSGNVYLTGMFNSTTDFDPGAGTANLTSAGSTDIFFAKYNNSGNYLWAKSIGSASSDYGYSIAADGLGNVYLTGQFQGTADFDPGSGTANLTPVGNRDIFFAKYDASGSYIWAKSIGGTVADYGYGIATDGSGNVFVTGNFQGTADFDPGAGTANLTSAGGYDIFFAKYDGSGNYLWANRIGSTSGDYGYSIAVDGSGNVYITGAFQLTADFDPGTGTANLTSAGFYDIFFAKYDTLGNYLWANRIGSPSSDWGYDITVDGCGNVYAAGSFAGTADFNPDTGTANLTSAGSTDIFFAKYSGGGSSVAPVSSFSVSNNTICSNDCINFADNSYTNSTTLWSWSFPGGNPSSSFLQNPGNVCYNTSGSYTVSLIVSNCAGSDTSTQIITVNALPAISISSASTVCYGDSATLTANGASDYLWSTSETTSAIVVAPSSSTTYTVTGTDSNGCSGTATVNITILPANIFSQTITLCTGQTITVGSNTYTASGTYTDILTAANGCDSIITTNLTVSSLITTSQNPIICSGQSVTIGSNTYSASGTYQDTLVAAGGCDSIVTTNLTVLPENNFNQTITLCFGQTLTVGNNTYSTSGTYTDTLSDSNSCDSTVTSNLTVLPANTFSQTITLCSGQSLSVGSNTYTTSGTYTDTLSAANGCDSTVTSNLTIITPDTSISVSGSTLTAISPSASYQWIDCSNGNAPIAGETNQSFTASASGNYAVIVTENGCSDTSSCYTIIVTGITETTPENNLLVYPNPTSGNLRITNLYEFTNYELKIYNVLGEKVYEMTDDERQTTNTQTSVIRRPSSVIIDLSSQPNGIYFLKIKSDNETATQKIIINR